MTLFMNLDTLPAGKAYYTVYVTTDPEGTARLEMGADEVDVVAARDAGWGDVCNNGQELRDFYEDGNHKPATNWILEMYGPDSRIIGVVNQSDGFVVYDAFVAGDEEGAG
jgi:hypothetical protein